MNKVFFLREKYLFNAFGWLLFFLGLVQLVQRSPRSQARWKRGLSAFLESLALASARSVSAGGPTEAMQFLTSGSRQVKQGTNHVQ
jgi:hypothetical protein